jgi:chaperonin cofactor prefoldin
MRDPRFYPFAAKTNKTSQTNKQKTRQAWWYMPVIQASQEAEVRRSLSKVTWAKVGDLPEKQTKSQRTRDMAQEIECLPTKCEALSSITSTANKQTNKLGCQLQASPVEEAMQGST